MNNEARFKENSRYVMAHVDLCLLEDFVYPKFQEFWIE